MSHVTRILSAIQQGDPHAAEQLLPLVYDELRQLAAQKLAHEKPGQTLDATALVHEAYLRLVASPGRESRSGGRESPEKEPHWANRRHFFAAAAEAMRRILVENARRKGRRKRGGDWRRLDLAGNEPAAENRAADVLAVDEALTHLSRDHPEKAELVKLRYFAGMTLADAAAALGISTATADRQWRYARAWLARQLRPDSAPGKG
jgi:RNA polymerase sigma factor (TIGR02999 family)